MTTYTRLLWISAALLALATGCETNPPGAGLTNGPALRVAPEKPALRSDLPTDTTPGQPGRETLGRLGDSTNDAGTGGRGGDASGTPDQPKLDQGQDDTVRATPPAIGAGNAAGATRPTDRIETGNPRSPH